jgi:hypothetical protein
MDRSKFGDDQLDVARGEALMVPKWSEKLQLVEASIVTLQL